MDRILRRQLDAIARDRSSGAAELVGRAATALRQWLERKKRLQKEEILSVAARLLTCQPLMAPMLRIANEVALAAEARHAGQAIASSLARIRKTLQRSPDQIARLFQREVHRKRIWSVCTYSYSSTVLRAILKARESIRLVTCSEGRPALEGRVLASRVAACGMMVRVTTDAELLSDAHRDAYQVLVVGADAIRSRFFVNKIGTSVLVRNAQESGLPVWVLADTLKFWDQPVFPAQLKGLSRAASQAAWPSAPEGVSVSDLLFDATFYTPNTRILTEKGWMTPRQVRRELRKIAISPRLRQLVD
jgi:translation initiation factor 2B subunit (eIF-2B alpha/beta/delta family)